MKVLELKNEVSQLKEGRLKLKRENCDLKKELEAKDKRSKAIFKRLMEEKDAENRKLKEDIEKLKNKLTISQQSEQIEELKWQLDVALDRSEEDKRAEDLQFSDEDEVDMLVRHRCLSQTL